MRDVRGFFGMETLESRRLLSGNVVVAVEAGVLNIVGDNQSNAFDVIMGGNVSLTGLNGTTINGGPQFTIDPAASVIKIDLRNGDDVVRVNRISTVVRSMSQSVLIDTGNGQDTVELWKTKFPVGLSVSTGAGDDTVLFQDCEINGITAAIDTGAGDDHVGFAGLVAGTGSITVNGGRGGDSVSGVASLVLTGTETFIGVETVA